MDEHEARKWKKENEGREKKISGKMKRQYTRVRERKKEREKKMKDGMNEVEEKGCIE